ncbi:unnamed protein product [Caenorhabditis sp. 36 PRJEB53466]|nr:unnamed protein product [Caenorhabditis sp. 36 PRJEB53466]
MEEENNQLSPISSSTSSSSSVEHDALVQVRHCIEEDKIDVDSVFAHRLVLSTFSPMFQQLLKDATSSDDITSIRLDLTKFPNGLAAFKVMHEAFYTGEIKLAGISPSEVLAVIRHCQVAGLESKVMSAAVSPMNIAGLLQPAQVPGVNSFVPYTPPVQNYLSNMLSLWTNPLFSAIFGSAATTLPFSPQSDTENIRTQSEGSSPRANSTATPPTTDLEKIVPNDDKEGWCRNKKYIEKVDGGFMCTVCRKIYGRYNSVSYHVTIYHRNPPIKCEENGCNFSTREARYIHFHKYYRHHIPLPENIDLGSRKCPFCRHVSKSPAMLEKHIARHEAEGLSGTPGALKRAQSKKKIVSTAPEVAIPNSIFTNTPVVPPIQCSLCQFTTFGTDILFMHLATAHTQELAQLGIADNSSETSASTSSNSDSEPITDIDIDVKPLIDQTLMLPLNTQI